MEPSGYKSRIENLKNYLYSRKEKIVRNRKNINLKEKDYNLKSDWGTKNPNEDNILNISDMMQKNKKSTLGKWFFVAVIFLLFSVVFAFFSFRGGGNDISSENIDIQLSGPVSIGAGDVLSLEVYVLNKNSVNLETADLLVEYPDGTRSSSDVKTELKRQRESLQTIKPNEKKNIVVKSILFGEENSKKEIKIGLEYRIPGSNAIFYTEKKYEIEINSSPVSLNVSSPKEINSGQEIEFKVDIKSNSENKIENLLLEAEFPFGFKLSKSNPESSFGDNLWDVDLKPLEKKTIYIKGSINGQDGEKRTFKFNIGIKKEEDEKLIEVNFVTYSEEVMIKKSFLSLNVALDKDSSSNDYIIGVGEVIRFDISWNNNLETKIIDAILKVKLNGDIIDDQSVSSMNGFYNSSDNTIIWDKRSIPELAIIESGNSGNTSFNFKSLNLIKNILTKVPEINVETTISGTEPAGQNSSLKNITTTVTKNIRISSDVLLNSRATYFSGKFINSGPIPPKVGSETTYTITISLSNSLNDVADGKVTMVLPPYLRWMGVISPSDEKISFNPIGGEIEWKVGDVYKGTGYSKDAREIQFQVAFIPSSSQRGSSAVLVDKIIFTGMDTFTDSEIKTSEKQLTTRIKTDTYFKDGNDIVN